MSDTPYVTQKVDWYQFRAPDGDAFFVMVASRQLAALFLRSLDVHKVGVSACLRAPGDDPHRRQEVRTFGTTTRALLRLADWLTAAGFTHVAMRRLPALEARRGRRHLPLCDDPAALLLNHEDARLAVDVRSPVAFPRAAFVLLGAPFRLTRVNREPYRGGGQPVFIATAISASP
jgi:hypothetical protein